MMQKPKELLARLLAYKDIVDQNMVPASNVAIVKKDYLSDTANFTPEVMANKSSAAKGLCTWVLNIVKYYDVIQVVEPKRQALKEAETQLSDANIKLEKVQAQVAELKEKLGGLQAQYDKAESESRAAEAEAEKCSKRLNSA